MTVSSSTSSFTSVSSSAPSSARDAFTCIGNLSSHSLDDYDLEEAAVKAVSHNAPPIELTQEEEKLFNTIIDATKAFENRQEPFTPQFFQQHTNIPTDIDTHNPIEIRIAGGWVRDKIMKQSSHDVDIALDKLSGHQFAILIQTYLLHFETFEKKQPKIAVIAANPNQSKHLETATMMIHGVDCDFVHLRGGEVYAENSRIPTLKEDATPLDDALRRDFTVNSLFYNLRKGVVEDWTGRGVEDLLFEKLLVTPLDARITFHDDPLRVLRAVRFAVRYDLILSEEIQMAAKSPSVHESLHVKVSRERVGKELEGMLTGKNAIPSAALKLMTDLKLAGCVFEFPHSNSTMCIENVKGYLFGVNYGSDSGASEVDRKMAREKSWLEATKSIKYCDPTIESFKEALGKQSASLDKTMLDSRMFYLASFLFPLRKMICVDSKGKEIPLPSFIIKDSIKFPNRDTSSISTIMMHVDKLQALVFRQSLTRLDVGLILRDLKDLWVTCLLVAIIAEIRFQQEKEDAHGEDSAKTISVFMEKAMHFYNFVFENDLDQCWKMKPLLDGKAVLKALDLPKGPSVGIYIAEQVKWMLLNPNGTKDECSIYLESLRKRDLDKEKEESNAIDADGDVDMGDAEIDIDEHTSKKIHR